MNCFVTKGETEVPGEVVEEVELGTVEVEEVTVAKVSTIITSARK